MELVFATNNSNKIEEIKKMIPSTIQLLSLEDIGCNVEIPETKSTIKGNAIQKVEFIKNNYGLNAFADDTGLEVTSLNGAPGVFSARYAGPQRNSKDNIKKLLKNLKSHSDRTAQFKTIIALHLNGKMTVFEGICKGKITNMEQGKYGFGYDPIFLPDGETLTFAEMSLAKKNIIGHRGKATNKLIKYLNQV